MRDGHPSEATAVRQQPLLEGYRPRPKTCRSPSWGIAELAVLRIALRGRSKVRVPQPLLNLPPRCSSTEPD